MGDSIWAGLGSDVFGLGKIEELSKTVQDVQAELIGSFESLNRRVSSLEDKVEILIVAIDALNNDEMKSEINPFSANLPMESNVFMFMSQKELGISEEAPEYVDDGVEVRSVKGFVGPPPEPVPDDEEVIEDEIPNEVREAYSQWKGKEIKWMGFVKICGGMIKAKEYRKVIES